MTRVRDIAGRSGLIQMVPTSIIKGASGTASAAANGQITFSGTEFVNLNGVFTSAYDNYKFIFQGFNNTSQHALSAQMSLNGTISATGYKYASFYAQSSSASGLNFVSSSNTNAIIGQLLSYANGNVWIYDITNPFQATPTSAVGGGQYANDSVTLWTGVTWLHSLSTAYDGIRISNGSGGTMTGTIRIYGYNNGT
jgi:hypothetical protein